MQSQAKVSLLLLARLSLTFRFLLVQAQYHNMTSHLLVQGSESSTGEECWSELYPHRERSQLKPYGLDLVFDPTVEAPNYNATPEARARARGFLPWPLEGGAERYRSPCGSAAARPLVSVVVPYYNAHEYLAGTLVSLRAQTLQRLEVLVVDDRSDDPAAVAALLAVQGSSDSRVRVLRPPTKVGLSGARNYGAQHARADYVFWCDPDDQIEPATLEKMLWFLAGHPQYAWVGAFTVGFQEKEYLWTKNFQWGETVLRRNVAHNAALVRRAAHLAVGGFDPAVAVFEDWDYWMRMADAGHWGHTLPEYLCWYRNKKTSLVMGGGGGGGGAAGATTWRDLDRDAFAAGLRAKYPRAAAAFPAPRRDRAAEEGLAQALDRELNSCRVPRGAPRSGPGRAVLLVPWLKPGGADEINAAVVRQLAEDHGWEVTVVGTVVAPGEELEDLLHGSRRADSCGGLRARFEPYTDDVLCFTGLMAWPAVLPFLRFLFETRDPDVALISHSELAYRLLPWLRAYFPRVALMDLVHIAELRWRGGGYPFFSALHTRYLDHTISISAQLKDWMVERGHEPDKISVYYFVYELVDCRSPPPEENERATSRAALGWGGPWEVAAVFVGRFVLQKRPELVLAVAKKLAEDPDLRTRPWRLVMVGDGPKREALRRELGRSKGGGLARRLQLLGNVPHAQTLGLLRAADVFLLPSENEGISIAMAEAMSFGLAVVASDVGAQAELLVPGTGRLVPYGGGKDDPPGYFSQAEVDAFAEELARLIRDPAAGRREGAAARERVCGGGGGGGRAARRRQHLLPLICRAVGHRASAEGQAAVESGHTVMLNTYFTLEESKQIQAMKDWQEQRAQKNQ